MDKDADRMVEVEVSSYSSTNDCCSVTDSGKFSAESCGDLGNMADFDGKTLDIHDEGEKVSSVNDDLFVSEIDGEENDGDFSFVCSNANGSPITADDAFQNGLIRPIFPLFNRDLLFSDHGDLDRESKEADSPLPPLRKLFVKESDGMSSSSASECDELEGVEAGTYCEWSRKVVKESPELGRKSNSTGFCKMWRFRDLVHRSKSDGKDSFVFLNNPWETTRTKPKTDTGSKAPKTEGEKKIPEAKAKKGVTGQTASSAHERHYVRNRAKKEEERRRSYLPYRQDLVGLFASVNGFSRNSHPF